MPIKYAVIGRRISEQRHIRNMTQLELADAVGISVRTLGMIENGRDIRLGVLGAIADALQIDVVSLLEKKEHAMLARLSLEQKDELVRYLSAVADLLTGQH